jgi:hypothetical protein
MSNALQPIELTDSELDAVSGGNKHDYKPKKINVHIKNSFNVISTSADGGPVSVGGSISAGGDVALGNGGDASVHIG